MSFDFTVEEHADHVILHPNNDKATEWFLLHTPPPWDGQIDKPLLPPIIEALRLSLFSIGHHHANPT